MNWAVAHKIVDGQTGPDGVKLLAPEATATRIEMAQFMLNLSKVK